MNEQFWITHRAAADRTSRAGLAGAVHGAIFLVLGGLAWSAGTLRDQADAIPFAYGALVLGLAFAAGRHSRVAVGLLLGVTLWVEGGAWLARHSLLTLAMLLVFVPIYVLGLVGAINWHRLEAVRRATETLTPAA
jgi:hypothetical protein